MNANKVKSKRVQLFIPCFVDQLYPETAFNMVKLLEYAGCEVLYNPKQTCCGQAAYNAGYVSECQDVARKFIKDYNKVDAIVAPSGSCTGFVRNYYSQLVDSHEATYISQQVFEFTEFLCDVLDVVDFGAHFNYTCTYHDACGSLRECGVKGAPRRLLSHVSGLILHETDDCEECCGFGGSFAVKFEPISVAMGEQKVKNAVASGVDYILSGDLSCLMHLDGYIQKYQYPIKTLHIVDVLASGLKSIN